MLKKDHDQISGLITEAVKLLCKSSIKYRRKVTIEGLLGITIDDRDVVLVNINEDSRNGGQLVLERTMEELDVVLGGEEDGIVATKTDLDNSEICKSPLQDEDDASSILQDLADCHPILPSHVEDVESFDENDVFDIQPKSRKSTATKSPNQLHSEPMLHHTHMDEEPDVSETKQAHCSRNNPEENIVLNRLPTLVCDAELDDDLSPHNGHVSDDAMTQREAQQTFNLPNLDSLSSLKIKTEDFKDSDSDWRAIPINHSSQKTPGKRKAATQSSCAPSTKIPTTKKVQARYSNLPHGEHFSASWGYADTADAPVGRGFCGICQKTYSMLRRHVNCVHTREIAVTCQICQRPFYRKDHWKLHMKNVHNVHTGGQSTGHTLHPGVGHPGGHPLHSGRNPLHAGGNLAIESSNPYNMRFNPYL